MARTLFQWRSSTTMIMLVSVAVILVAIVGLFISQQLQPRTQVKLGSGVFSVSLADTDQKKIQGLSGVSSLGTYEGMLFLFNESDLHGIWMKDMKIPIDIIWLDEAKRVVHIVKDASPETGESVTYTPSKPARYVLELSAGSVQRNAIQLGSVATWELAP